MTPLDNDTNSGASALKEWRQPELRKLPIEATLSGSSKTGSSDADVLAGPKNADAAGQFS